MEETNITINFDAAKLDALEFALRKQRSSVQRRMAEMLQQLYEAEVPKRCGSMWTARPRLPQGPSDRQNRSHPRRRSAK